VRYPVLTPLFYSFIHPFLFDCHLLSFAAAVRPLVDLFPAKVIGCSNLANAGVPPRVSRKNLPLRLSSVFPHQPCQIVSATFWRQKNKSQRSQTG
ncbi:hypothetical protein ACIXN2_15965, partial [Bacteroides fragilis]